MTLNMHNPSSAFSRPLARQEKLAQLTAAGQLRRQVMQLSAMRWVAVYRQCSSSSASYDLAQARG